MKFQNLVLIKKNYAWFSKIETCLNQNLQLMSESWPLTSEDLNFKAQNGEFDPELLDLISRAYINIEPLRKDETIFLHSLNTF